MNLAKMSVTEVSLSKMRKQLQVKNLTHKKGPNVDLLDELSEDSDKLRTLMDIYEISDDSRVMGDILFIIRSAVALKSPKRQICIQNLVNLRATRIVVKSLPTLSETDLNKSFIVHAIVILKALATQDSNFSSYFESKEVLHVLAPILKRLNACGPKFAIIVLLQIILAIAKNSKIVDELTTMDSVQSLLSEIANVIQRLVDQEQSRTRLKVVPNIFHLMSKHDTAVEVLGKNPYCLRALLKCVDQIPIEKHQIIETSLHVLNKLVSKAKSQIEDCHGVEILRGFCERHLDTINVSAKVLSLVHRSYAVLCKLMAKSFLPIDDPNCPFHIPLPRDVCIRSDTSSRESTPESDETSDNEVLTESNETADAEDEEEEDIIAEKVTPGLKSDVVPSTNQLESCLNDPTNERLWGFFGELKATGETVDMKSLTRNETEFSEHFVPNVDCPEVFFAESEEHGQEPLNPKDHELYRLSLIQALKRLTRPKSFQDSSSDIVYNLDTLIKQKHFDLHHSSNDCLRFESRFESGNLRKVIRISDREYDLILTPDLNGSRICQWFFFEVKNVRRADYTFNIINFERANSQFKLGMQPVMFSKIEANKQGKPFWFRAGRCVSYLRNGYINPNKSKDTYLTATIKINFPHDNDTCYLAYHYPYTYLKLKRNLETIQRGIPNDIWFRCNSLTKTLLGRDIPMLTITSNLDNAVPMEKRPIVFITSRVHSGESNASWIVDGIIQFLTGRDSKASILRSKYIFKIIPMLNVEGVIHGSSRSCETGEDMNRLWDNPDLEMHPAIFWTKSLLTFSKLVLDKNPVLFCDIHGHSRKKNVFWYGCSPRQSWTTADLSKQDLSGTFEDLANRLESISPAFRKNMCRYTIERCRESTARIVAWRQLGIQHSFTIEATFCGFNAGNFKGYHVNCDILRQVGRDFLIATLS